MIAGDSTLPAHYDAAAAAARHQARWQVKGYGRGRPEAPGPAYGVIMPPPNVTGVLHMGHALNGTLQDVLVRYKRMCGYNVVWIPGLDHASIAVHWVVERQLRDEGTSRQALGREAFLARAQAFKDDCAGRIAAQQACLGLSCDWERLAFTLDAPRQTAVVEAFVRLYEDGLIYRAERLVNWDPVSQTSVSDLEVTYEENVLGELYNFAYPLADGEGELVVATTRPETIFGDTAVAVHPKDPRYAHLIGRMLRHPLDGRRLPIVGDAALVDPSFGSGAVKITPAHDFNDFEVGRRHGLASINVLNRDGTMADVCGDCAGLPVAEGRQTVKARLAALGLDRGSRPHRLNVGRSERSGAILEPMVSTQWYVRAKPLARPSVAAVERGRTQFHPPSWANTYFSWLSEIRDWCISRQLWWGHRIPAWHCRGCSHIAVARHTPDACPRCGASELQQDEDVLDTWFSSALWPMSTQGWPALTPELQRWYPTATLVTGFDLIFFWVARMMMFGLYFTGEAPFAHIVMHALIRDARGEKMSKTRGNVVDPLAMVDKFGADAFRFTLVAFAAQGRDVRWDEDRAAGYQRFCNKIWQAWRFVLAHGPPAVGPAAPSLGIWDRWILQKLRETTCRVHAALDAFRFNDAAAALYGFVWEHFCDWYLEVAKVALRAAAADGGGDAWAAAAAAQATLLRVFDSLARLLHPFMPYLSEEIWQRHPDTHGDVVMQPYPQPDDIPEDAGAMAETHFIAKVIVAIRRVRADYGMVPHKRLRVVIRAAPPTAAVNHGAWLTAHAPVVASLARADMSAELDAAPPGRQLATARIDGTVVGVDLTGAVDFAAERARLGKEQGRVQAELSRLAQQLDRADFMARAPTEVVEAKQAQRVAAQARLGHLQAMLARLSHPTDPGR